VEKVRKVKASVEVTTTTLKTLRPTSSLDHRKSTEIRKHTRGARTGLRKWRW